MSAKRKQDLTELDRIITLENPKGADFDEALLKRKKLYEDLFPETRQHVAAALTKHANETGAKRPAPTFAVDAAEKLGVARKTVERAIARASKASDRVMAAYRSGVISSGKVDILVALSPSEQDELLPAAKKSDLSELKRLVESAKKHGARATLSNPALSSVEGVSMRSLVSSVMALTEQVQRAIDGKLIFEGESKHDALRALDSLVKKTEKLAGIQRSALGYVKAISKKGSDAKGHRREA